MRSLGALLAMGLVGAPLAAEVSEPAFLACAAQMQAAGESLAPCVNRAQEQCLSYPADLTAAAIQCFRAARADWADLSATRIGAITARNGVETADIARIEVKYDTLGGILQCDRLNALTLLSQEPSDALVLQQARCTATASGFAYLRLWLASGGAEAAAQ